MGRCGTTYILLTIRRLYLRVGVVTNEQTKQSKGLGLSCCEYWWCAKCIGCRVESRRVVAQGGNI